MSTGTMPGQHMTDNSSTKMHSAHSANGSTFSTLWTLAFTSQVKVSHCKHCFSLFYLCSQHYLTPTSCWACWLKVYLSAMESPICPHLFISLIATLSMYLRICAINPESRISNTKQYFALPPSLEPTAR